MERKSGLGKFVGGLIVGASLGVLFAPKKGEETRKELMAKMDKLIDDAKDIDIEEVKDNINNKISDIKAELASLDKEKVMSLAKEQAEHIKSKCNDLVKYAMEKGTPLLEATANSVKNKTIEVLKDTLDKLEKTENTKKKNK
jgi:gas vesicle protein